MNLQLSGLRAVVTRGSSGIGAAIVETLAAEGCKVYFCARHQGLVSRQADPRDARVGYATLTDSGRQLLGYAVLSVRAAAHELTEPVPADQLEAVAAWLGQLAGMNSSNS